MEDNYFKVAYLLVLFIVYADSVFFDDLPVKTRKWLYASLILIPVVAFTFIGMLHQECFNCGVPIESIRPFFYGFLLSTPVLFILSINKVKNKLRQSVISTSKTNETLQSQALDLQNKSSSATTENYDFLICKNCSEKLPAKRFYFTGLCTCNCGSKYHLLRKPKEHSFLEKIINFLMVIFAFIVLLNYFKVIEESIIVFYIQQAFLVSTFLIYAFTYFHQSTVIWKPRRRKKVSDDSKILGGILVAVVMSFILVSFFV